MLVKYIQARLGRGEEGQALVEYALIISLIAVALVAGLTFLSGNLNTVFTNIAGGI